MHRSLWDVENECMVEVSECSSCRALRPEVMQKVKCKLLEHQEYFRFVANPRRGQGQREIVVRMQEEGSLDFWKLPSYVLSSKVVLNFAAGIDAKKQCLIVLLQAG